MGHDSVRAALIHRHATADAAIADAMHAQIERGRHRSKSCGDEDDGDGGPAGTLILVVWLHANCPNAPIHDQDRGVLPGSG